MDELIDIVNQKGEPTGKTELKSYAHSVGLFHATVHIWFYTTDGKVLLQKRGRNKKTFPLLWDVSVAGHSTAGEEIEIAAMREVKEEIGIDITADLLQKIGVFKSVQKHSSRFIDCEFHHTFLCELTVPFTSLKKQETEVEELQLIDLEDFKMELNNMKTAVNYAPHGKKYYESILKAIPNRL